MRKDIRNLLPVVRSQDHGEEGEDEPGERDIYMPQDRYVAALRRQRARISAGLALTVYNSDCVGDKGNSVSWGLCSEDPDSWPEERDHLWPDQFLMTLRVAPKYLKKGQHCPFDDVASAPRGSVVTGPSGCFYRCRIFRAHYGPTGVASPDRDEALRLYDEAIAKADG